MAKLWCPICKRPHLTQVDINAHLLSAHNHKVTPKNEAWYRKLQNKKWKARREKLDEDLRQNARLRRQEWEAFANNAKFKAVPTGGMSDQLVLEMVFLNEIDDDSDGEDSESECVESEASEEATTDLEFIPAGKAQSTNPDATRFDKPKSNQMRADAMEAKEIDQLRLKRKRREARDELYDYKPSEETIDSGDCDESGDDADDELEESQKQRRKRQRTGLLFE